MVRTPWGDSDELRTRQLAPGRSASRAEVVRSQRERLFAAMVAASFEHGYEATSVADLLRLSGVSRKAFYEHFANKQECFEATLAEILARAERAFVPLYDGRGSALAAFIELIVADPAAARMCFVEAFVAGDNSVAQIDATVAGVEALYAQAFGERDGTAMAPELVVAIVGGLRKVIYTRLRRRSEADLRELSAQLGEWSLGYCAPPRQLARGRPPGERADGGRKTGARERIIAAASELISERGYPASTVRAIISRAETSSVTFYKYFESKEDVLDAALDLGQARLSAVSLAAYEAEERWPDAVRAGFEAMLDFLAADPTFAELGLVAVMSGTERALELRDRQIEALQAFLDPGYERSPKTPPIAAEAIGGATYELIYRRARAGQASRLGEAAPLLTYLTLAPFLGAEEACAVANGESRVS